MKHTSVLILQNRIPHYRTPIFNAIGTIPDISLKVLHSGPPTISHSTPTAYQEEILPVMRLGRFFVQQRVLESARDADVVIAMFDPHWINNNLLSLLPRAKRSRLIYWGHGYGRNALVKPFRTLLARRADALLLYSEKNIKEFVRQGIPREKIFVAPNTIAVPKPSNSPHSARKNFLFVGRLQRRKNVADLLIAFAQAVPHLPDATGVEIIGEGPEEEALRDMSESLGISHRVVFRGHVTDHATLAQSFAHALAYISPGATGLGILHSFAHGVPVVTTRHAHHGPEIDNVFEDENGLFYDGSIQSLAGVLRRLASNNQFTSALAQNAFDFYWNYRTPQQMASGFHEAIRYVSTSC